MCQYMCIVLVIESERAPTYANHRGFAWRFRRTLWWRCRRTFGRTSRRTFGRWRCRTLSRLWIITSGLSSWCCRSVWAIITCFTAADAINSTSCVFSILISEFETINRLTKTCCAAFWTIISSLTITIRFFFPPQTVSTSGTYCLHSRDRRVYFTIISWFDTILTRDRIRITGGGCDCCTKRVTCQWCSEGKPEPWKIRVLHLCRWREMIISTSVGTCGLQGNQTRQTKSNEVVKSHLHMKSCNKTIQTRSFLY